ncbi:Cna B-type domain-containing protein [Lentilactobacillus otakiensis]|uniref:Cna B-type domain-containing protein n=1 Tax=Lentilactobacillus otakiensis TaxID=481720 RepID=UPI003D183F5A
MEKQFIYVHKQIPTWLAFLLLLVTLLIGLGSQIPRAQAADITDSISGISSSDASYNGKPITQDEIKTFDKSTTYPLKYTYKIKSATKVNEGDTATVSLPAGTHFHDAQSFDILSNDGSNKVIGTFRAAANATSGTITFTNYFTTHNNDMGGTISLPVSGEADSTPDTSGDYITKAGFQWKGSWEGKGNFPLDANGRYQYAEWDAKINPNNKSLTDVVVTDTLKNTDSQQLIPDDLVVQYADNDQAVPANDYTLTYVPATNPTGFTIKWNGTLSKAVNVLYLVKVTDPAYRATGAATTLNNHIEITGNDSSKGSGKAGNIDYDNGHSDAHVDLGGNANGGGTVYNLTVTKNWVGAPSGTTLPKKIQAQLYRNGKKFGNAIPLNKDNKWTGTFSGLNKTDANGKTYTYTVAEVAVPDGWSGTTDPQAFDTNNHATLTNTYKPVTPATTSIKVTKTWQGVPSGVKLPGSVTATLYADGKSTGKTVTLTEANKWTASFGDLAVKNDAGNDIKYTVVETQVKGYTSPTSGAQTPKSGVVALTNVYTPKTRAITVKKQWTGVPAKTETPSVTAILYANGKATDQKFILDSKNNYQATIDNLPTTDADGKPITYTVVEDKVDGYNMKTTGQQTPNKDGLVTLINAFIPKTTTVNVKKVWQDVPTDVTTPSITATLYANGKSTGKTVTLDQSNNYFANFGDLPTTDADGKPIVYTVVEDKVPDGYKSSTSGQQPVKDGTATLINTYIPTTPVTPVTPVTPDTPVTPVTPVTPDTPDKPVTPSHPKNPKPNKPKKSPQKSEEDQSIPAPKSSTDSSAPVSSSTGKLPQTGDDQFQTFIVMIAGGLLVGLVGIGKFVEDKIRH